MSASCENDDVDTNNRLLTYKAMALRTGTSQYSPLIAAM